MSVRDKYRDFFKEKKGEIFEANKKTGVYAFEFLSVNKLPAGVYYFRLLPPHPDKAPDGALYYATHSIPDGSKWGKKVRCTADGDKPGKCYLCDLRVGLQKSHNFRKLPSKLQEQFAAMVDTWGQMRYATAWFVDVKTATKTDEDGEIQTIKSFKANKEREEEQGFILDVWQKAVVEGLQELEADHKYLTHKEKGNLVKLKITGSGKTTRYKVSLGPKKPLLNQGLLKKYPDLEEKLEYCTFDYDHVLLEFLDTKLASLMDKADVINLKDPLNLAKSKRSKRIAAELDNEDDDEEEDDFEDDDEEDADSGEDDYEEDDYDEEEDEEEEEDEGFESLSDRDLIKAAWAVNKNSTVRKCKAYYIKRKHLQEKHRDKLIEILEDA